MKDKYIKRYINQEIKLPDEIKKQIKKRFPKLKVELNLISLDSKITKF